MGRPWNNVLAKKSGGRVGVTCARKSQQRAQRCAARLNKLCVCASDTPACAGRWHVRSEGLRAYAELQRKHRAAYGDNEEATRATVPVPPSPPSPQPRAPLVGSRVLAQ